MKEKRIIVKFKNGKTCTIPAKIVAEDIAKYHGIIDGYDDESQEYFNEYLMALDDDFILFDWIENKMTWKELYQYVKDLDDDPLHMESMWINGDRVLSIK